MEELKLWVNFDPTCTPWLPAHIIIYRDRKGTRLC